MSINVILEITMNFLENSILLFSLLFIFSIMKFDEQKSFTRKALTGLIIGVLTLLLMSDPWRIDSGLIFDARSVILSVSGLFFGFIPTSIAAFIAMAYRISLGGSGVYSGVLTLVVASFVGLYWEKMRLKLPKVGIYIEYLLFGFIVHVATLLCFLTIPYPRSIEIIRNVSVPYLVLFPVVTMLISVLMHNQREKLGQEKIILDQQNLLQASIDATPVMEIFAVDQNYLYLSMNSFHRNQMELFYHEKIQKGYNYLNYIHNEKMRNRIKKLIDEALAGKFVKMMIEVEVTKDKYLEESYTPIRNDKGEVVGVTVFSEEVTERYLHEQSILHLSYRDALTNLYNRRYYQEQIKRLDEQKYYPLAVVFADINGLKLVNDAFGHDAGDELIKIVAEELLISFHKEQNVARIGGDEFAILLPKTTKNQGQSLIDTAKIRLQDKTIYGMSVSVSFGIGVKEENESLNLVLKQAENDMYENKIFEITSQRSETIRTILKTLHEKNPREEAHSSRVSLLCQKIGERLGMRANDLNLLKTISVLHDIGKITIDDQILNKPGKLNEQEWEAIKKHPEVGYRILSSSPEYMNIAEDILSHHERYDGQGYPRGIKGDAIPIRARIIAIADSYDAMVSDRPYRKALTHEEAIEEIMRCSGTQFDPEIAKEFIEIFEKERV